MLFKSHINIVKIGIDKCIPPHKKMRRNAKKCVVFKYVFVYKCKIKDKYIENKR
jgi:hypothetical protein